MGISCKNRKRGVCGKKDCDICLPKSFASHPKAKFWSPKNELEPHQVPLGAKNECKFICDECGHEFEAVPAKVSNIKNPRWCNYCGGDALCEDENCDVCFEKSFASHERAANWSLLNFPVTPKDIRKCSGKSFFFDCDDCGHTFSMDINHIHSRNQWCPFCGGKQLCPKDVDCNWCFDRSFASHERAEFWSERNILSAREVRKFCNKIFLFFCVVCGHHFPARPGAVATDPTWCGFCGQGRLCSRDVDCSWCFNHSFASDSRSECWSDKNFPIIPRDVRSRSSQSFIFDCDACGREFTKRLEKFTRGSWCPYCKNKTESMVLDFVRKKFKNVVHQARFDWCRSQKSKNQRLPFDICVGKTIIEVDGPQHFRQVSNWGSSEEVQKNDRYKEEKAGQNGYRVVRLVQADVWKNAYDWKAQVLAELEGEIRK